MPVLVKILQKEKRTTTGIAFLGSQVYCTDIYRNKIVNRVNLTLFAALRFRGIRALASVRLNLRLSNSCHTTLIGGCVGPTASLDAFNNNNNNNNN